MSDDNENLHPNCITRDADPDYSNMSPQCIHFDKVHYCHAVKSQVWFYDDEPWIVVGLSKHDSGLRVDFTVEGAREFAMSLLNAAQEMEERLTSEAKAQLAATLAKPANGQ